MSTIADGYAIFSEATSFGSHALVTCRKGYENIGETNITCLAGGSWSTHASCSPKGKTRPSFDSLHILNCYSIMLFKTMALLITSVADRQAEWL